MNFSTLAAFGLYFVSLLIIGLFFYRRSKTATDFILGGRSLNYYVTALSAHASDMSSWLFMAYPALIFVTGGVSIWAGVGLLLGMWSNWQLVARRLRQETERTQSLTLSDYFAKRFGDRSGILAGVGAILSLLFFTVYVSAGLVGMGFLFDAVFGIDAMVGMGVGLAVVVLYTMVGGFNSVCWVDLFQALFLLAMLIMVPVVALVKIGGLGVLETAVTGKGLSLSLLPEGGWQGLPQILLLTFGWGLGYFGQTHILSKFMGISDPKEVVKSKRIGMTWQTLCLAAATLVGLVGVAYFPEGLGNSELVFVGLVKLLFHPFVAGLILCGILAATISTMDAQILVLVSVLTQDLYHKLWRKQASQKERVWSSRIAVALVSCLAFVIAVFSGRSVMDLVFYAWSGLGSTFGPILFMALYSKRANWYGAVAGMVFGGLVAAAWPSIGPLLPIEIPALIPGFFGNLLVIYSVSLLTEKLKQPLPMGES